MAITPGSPYTNMLSYLKWRGDIPFSKDFPINEIDHLILARFSYLNFNSVGYGQVERTGSIAAEIAKLPDSKFIVYDDKLMAKALADSARFKDLPITDIQIHNDKEIQKQFGAITFLLPDDEIYISYLGTDDTILGWKEDFNMTFLEHIPSQTEGLKYLQTIAAKYPSSKIRIGGHSKGGNIAMFAALAAPEAIQKRIITVKNYDGPGFDHDRVQFHKTPEILNKITTYFPQESMIGRLLDHDEQSIVVESFETGLAQHDVFTWSVNVTDFVPVKDAKQVHYVFNKSLRKLLDQCTLEQRKLFFDAIHDAIIKANYERPSDMRRDATHALPAIIRSYRNHTTPAQRKEIANIVKKFARDLIDESKANSKEESQKNASARRANKDAAHRRREAREQNGLPYKKPLF